MRCIIIIYIYMYICNNCNQIHISIYIYTYHISHMYNCSCARWKVEIHRGPMDPWIRPLAVIFVLHVIFVQRGRVSNERHIASYCILFILYIYMLQQNKNIYNIYIYIPVDSRDLNWNQHGISYLTSSNVHPQLQTVSREFLHIDEHICARVDQLLILGMGDLPPLMTEPL